MIFSWHGSQVARQGSAKPLYGGSIPPHASYKKYCRSGGMVYAEDLKSLPAKGCGFESHLRHTNEFRISGTQARSVFSPRMRCELSNFVQCGSQFIENLFVKGRLDFHYPEELKRVPDPHF